jgi:uridylate kinase
MLHSSLLMKSIVISIGGSIVLSEAADISYFKELSKLIGHISQKYKIYIIVGGGKTARTYIKLGRQLGFDENTLDELGIEITRINAKILSNIIHGSNQDIPNNTDDARDIQEHIVIMGGTTPGHSTDMVGAELAEKIQASKFIIATNVDGIFDKDPNIFSDAKQLKEISIECLIKKYGTAWDAAGKNIVIDGPALKIIHRAKIPTFVLNGKKLDELEKAIKNQEFNGTIIKE